MPLVYVAIAFITIYLLCQHFEGSNYCSADATIEPEYEGAYPLPSGQLLSVTKLNRTGPGYERKPHYLYILNSPGVAWNPAGESTANKASASKQPLIEDAGLIDLGDKKIRCLVLKGTLLYFEEVDGFLVGGLACNRYNYGGKRHPSYYQADTTIIGR